MGVSYKAAKGLALVKSTVGPRGSFLRNPSLMLAKGWPLTVGFPLL